MSLPVQKEGLTNKGNEINMVLFLFDNVIYVFLLL